MVTNDNKNEFVPYTEHNGLYLACLNFNIHWQGVILYYEEGNFRIVDISISREIERYRKFKESTFVECEGSCNTQRIYETENVSKIFIRNRNSFAITSTLLLIYLAIDFISSFSFQKLLERKLSE